MKLGIQIWGDKAYGKAMKDYGKAVDRKLRAVFNASAMQLASYARVHAPVSADLRKQPGILGGPPRIGGGRLRNSITHEVSVKGGTLTGAWGTNMAYAPYLEAKTGSRRIAHGRLRKWKQGQAPIVTWPAKEKRGRQVSKGGGEQLPLLRPAWDVYGKRILKSIKKAGA